MVKCLQHKQVTAVYQVLAAAIFVARSGLAGRPLSYGREFIFAIPLNGQGRADIFFTISNPNDESVTAHVTSECIAGEIRINRKSSKTVTLQEACQTVYMEDGVGEFTEPKGIKIQTSHPTSVVVSSSDRDRFSVSAFAVRPRKNVGSNYYIVTLPVHEDPIPDKAFFTVIAHSHGSTPTHVQVFGKHNNLVHNVTLHALQTYTYVSSVDLTGWRVSADKNVSVVVGNRCAAISSEVCDTAVEMAAPVSHHGTLYPVVALGRTLENKLRVIATADNTALYFSPHANSTRLNAGQHIDFILPAGTVGYLQASKTVVVYQATSSDMITGYGDTALFIVPSVNAGAHSCVLHVPNLEQRLAWEHYVVIVTKRSQVSKLLLDNAPLSGNEWQVWKEIAGTDYSAKITGLRSGLHNVTFGSERETFTAVIFGFDDQQAYAYTPACKPLTD